MCDFVSINISVKNFLNPSKRTYRFIWMFHSNASTCKIFEYRNIICYMLVGTNIIGPHYSFLGELVFSKLYKLIIKRFLHINFFGWNFLYLSAREKVSSFVSSNVFVTSFSLNPLSFKIIGSDVTWRQNFFYVRY